MRRTVPPSAEIEARIDQLLAVGVGDDPRETLSQLAKLGARLIIQRAVEDEFDAWLGRARYERRPADQAPRREEETGLRNGFRARRVQTAEGELAIEIPQVRQAAETFASKLFPRTPKLLRTEPLKALVIGAFVRGLSMRDVESLCEQAGLGKLSKSTASRICEELKERFQAFCRRDLYDIRLVALFLDATFIAVRPDGPKEGVQVAWGFTDDGERVLLAVSLGMRESFEDWQSLGRDLIARGLGAPMLIVADGAPGLTKAIEQCWPASDRQRCCVHRARNLYAKLPDRERERVKHAYWQALDDAISEQDAKRRLQALVDDLDKGGFTAASRCLADDLDALVVHLRYPVRHRRRWRSTNLLERSLGEVKRRTKVMGRFPGETSCLTLVWAVLDLLITHQTNGIHFTALDRQHLKRARHEGTEQTLPEEVTAA
ncbi:MAG TPA: IS256 family transposase [Solirubrobacteraceae bacterium]|nr:IS256 family transposase [Solirubrobacteraceae bacterium]